MAQGGEGDKIRRERRCEVSEERRASVQGAHGYLPFPEGTIAWWEHEEAWLAYAKRFGFTEQSAERMHERGGFGIMELCSFLGRPPSTWRPAPGSVTYVMSRAVLDEKEGAK